MTGPKGLPTWLGWTLLALCAAVQWQALPSATGTPSAVTGTVDGTVTIAAAPSRRLTSPGAYPGRTVTVGAAGAGSELANVIVFVDARPATPPPPMRATVRQTNEVFLPHVVAVTTGSLVDFPNDDAIFHNVFSLSRAATFDLGRYPQGAAKTRRFDKPGLVKVFCHLHSHMSAVVRVFDHPHFARPDGDGRFVIDGVPAGQHRVVAWHERVGEVSHDAVVEDGGRVTLAFALPLTDVP